MRYNLEAMALKDLVIRSQLIPPRQKKGVLRRPRLEARLAEVLDYPLTLVQAGTGYGKSTSLVSLADVVDPLFWYTITEPDRDPLLFLAHLVCAFEREAPAWCEPVFQAVEETGGRVTPELLTPLLNTLTSDLEGEAVLVLDDYHLVADVPEIAALVERLVDYAPPRLHVVLSTRHVPPLEALTRWRVKGQLLSIGRTDLAFTAEEVEVLFSDEYGVPLSPEQAQTLATETEGWVIALQMVWQGLQSSGVSDVEAVLGQLPASLDALFDYLAQDVLARQPPNVQDFLLMTSVLRQMDGAACDYLLGVEGSVDGLHELQESGLFVVSMGDDVYRYHRLFHDFLRARLRQEPQGTQALHRRAAAYFQRADQLEETVYHLLAAEEYAQAAEQIEEIGPRLVSQGRFDSLSAWINRLPEKVLSAQPGLYLLLGDVLRLRVQFDEALEHYRVAERLFATQPNRVGRSHALRGQAQVYLDTVRPLMADSLLEEALRLLEPAEHQHETADLLDKLAENKLNLGYPEEAQALHHEAGLLRAETEPGDVYLEARAMVRTGRLAEAQRLLERRAEEERMAGESRPQRFHRETLLLLSLVHSLQGNAVAAERDAREGIAVGQRLHSAFVEAVGHMRLGHALQLREAHPWDVEPTDTQQALVHYQHSIAQIRTFRVMRTQVEPLWGLCRAYGYSGDLLEAQRHAEEAIEIATRAGDEWIRNLVQGTLGAGCALSGQWDQADEWLAVAAEGFAQVGDPHGQAAALLWLALSAWRQGDGDRAAQHLSHLLPLARQQECDALLTRPTFLGLQGGQAAIPLLLEARARGIEIRYAERLLDTLGVAGVEYHPGYGLAVQTLGSFAVWRGTEPVTARDWQREKARQIFQLLLTYRGQWFYREQIVDHLWPHLPPDAAERDFKVALNALTKALEPQRPRGAPSFFVVRRGTVYGLNPAAHIVVDTDDFQRLAGSDEVAALRQALALYEEDYLPDSLYEDWSAAERQRLRHLYLTTAERLARHLLQDGSWHEIIEICQVILARDNCWEAAYRLLMQVYAAQGNHTLLHSTYQRCSATLQEELGLEPSPSTQALFERLKNQEYST
ncbi:MAG: BTAD domain-containing putative transcriptional regulator [Anaerolineae bacterium]|jgi:DNA-binding SARP family transcriptional activator/tetratricopeptide (TPR) repeat protein